MKNKVIGCILCLVLIIAVVFGALYTIDHKRMENNEPVLFSAWGKQYAPPEENQTDKGTTETFTFNNLELEVSNVYRKEKRTISDRFETREYDVYVVYPGAEVSVKNVDMWLGDDGKKHSNWAFHKVAAESSYIVDNMEPTVITDSLIGVYNTELSVTVLQFEIYNKNSFVATILEETTTYMIVEPVYEKMDAYIGEKVKIEYGTDHYDYLYGVGRRVVIYYEGNPEETADGMKLIKTDDISTEGFREFELEVVPSEEKVKKEIVKRTPPTDSSGKWWTYGDAALYYYGVENVLITIKGWTMPLEKALEEGRITLNGIIANCDQDVQGRIIEEISYDDGGSSMYKYPEYTIIKYHTLDGNSDVYIGSTDMDINIANE